MSSMYFKGGAAAVSQVDRFTPANVEVGDTFTLTVKDESNTTIATIAFVAAATTVASVTAGLKVAWDASAIALAEAASVDGTTYFQLTATAAGKPFYVTSTTTDGGGANTQTLARTATTASKGPLDWNCATNWSGGAVPVSTDSVVLDGRAANGITYGLNQSGVTLASLDHYRSFGSAVGTSTFALKISATTANINNIPTDGTAVFGTSLFNIDTSTNATTTSVFGSPSQGASGLAPVIVNGSHASNILNIYGGIVGVGTLTPGGTGNYPTVSSTGGTTEVAAGVTITTLTINGGTIITRGNVSGTTTLSQGTLTAFGTMATFQADGGTAYICKRTTAITTCNWNGATLDFTKSAAAVTITTMNIKKGGFARVFSASQLTMSTVTVDPTNGSTAQFQVG